MILRERATLVLLLGCALAVLLAWLLPAPADPVLDQAPQEYHFYLRKTHGAAASDIVLMGDSRVLRGVSPGEIERVLPGREVFNFAFNAGGLNPEMYDAAQRRLDASAEKPMIVLGVTPLSLLDWKSRNEQYREFLDKPLDDVVLKLRWPRLFEFLRPRRPSDLVAAVTSIPLPAITDQVFHPDGWIETDRQPIIPDEALHVYGAQLADTRIDPTLVDDLVERTRDWSRRGIAVVAFRPPTTPALAALEDTLTGFDEAALAAAVTAAGGIWIPFASGPYDTYDGSHLRRESARAFSHDLAVAIAERIVAPATPRR